MWVINILLILIKIVSNAYNIVKFVLLDLHVINALMGIINNKFIVEKLVQDLMVSIK